MCKSCNRELGVKSVTTKKLGNVGSGESADVKHNFLTAIISLVPQRVAEQAGSRSRDEPEVKRLKQTLSN